MRRYLMLIAFLLTSVYSNSLVDNNMDKLMYDAANKTKYTKGQMYYYKEYVLPLLESSKTLYINDALELPERLENLRDSWKIYIDVLSASTGAYLNKGTVLTGIEKNSFKKISLNAAKKGAKLLVKGTFSSILDTYGFGEQNNKIILKNISPVIELIMVDLSTATSYKEKLATLTKEFIKQGYNAMLNMSAWIKSIELHTYYQSYTNIINFLEEYYKCGADVDLLIKRNNLTIKESERDNIGLIALKYSSKDAKILLNDTFLSIRNELLSIVSINIKSAEKFTKLAIETELKQREEVRYRNYLLREHIKQNAYDKVYTENKSYRTKVYNLSGLKYMVSFDYDADDRIDKCVDESKFYSGVNYLIGKDFSTIVDQSAEYLDLIPSYERSTEKITIKDALKLLDMYSNELLNEIGYGDRYKNFSINPKGKLNLKFIYKSVWYKKFNDLGLEGYIKRQYTQMQAGNIDNLNDEMHHLDKCLTGYKAVDFIKAYRDTLWWYLRKSQEGN